MICRDCCGSGEDDVYPGRCRVCGGTGQIGRRDTGQPIKPPDLTPARKYLGCRRFMQHHHMIVIAYFEGDPVPDWAKDTPLITPGSQEERDAPYTLPNGHRIANPL